MDVRPPVPEMATAWDKGHVEYLTTPGRVELPVRVYDSDEAANKPVVMLHGLQSHSGWFVQSSCHLASLGCPVYAIDRRGSGLSRQRRGHIKCFQQLIDDIDVVVRHVTKVHRTDRVHVMGHCFGAIPAVLYAYRHPQRTASVILAAPALYTRVTFCLPKKMAIAGSRLYDSTRYLPIPFPIDLLTEIPAYRGFIASDPLCLKELTAIFYWALFRSRFFLSAKAGRLRVPVFMALAGKDQISHNAKNEMFFGRLSGRPKRLRTYPGAMHILEFCREREAFFRDLTEWIARASSNRLGDHVADGSEDQSA